jgi:NADPH:quinone reductase-like Zn-dependent oxidoreductase
MRAAVIEGYGGVDRLEIRERPDPGPPAPGQVLLRVLAAGVNPIDWKRRRGDLRFVMPGSFPMILGRDVAGEVEEVGPEVTRFQPGDPVFGTVEIQSGSYAERALARESSLAPLPGRLTWEEAASLPVAGLTALQALRDLGELVSGERVLVNGASGGVGHFAVQIAFAMGAEVTGVASRRNLDFVRGLGAHEGIEYEDDDFTSRDDAWEVIFDAAGNRTYRDCEPALAREGGVYVTTQVGPRSFINSTLTGLGGIFGQKKRSRFIVVKHRAEDLSTLARFVDRVQVKPVIQEVFPLERIRAAHELAESGKVRGKIVLRMS